MLLVVVQARTRMRARERLRKRKREEKRERERERERKRRVLMRNAIPRFGVPDAGLVSRAEMEEAARVIIRASAAASAEAGGAAPPPVVVDGDTGYGGAANVRATVRGLAAAGAAAVTIEDQEWPKRCTVVAGGGVRVVSRHAAARRVAAALAARDEARSMDGREIMVVARTDCRRAEGLEEAIARCQAFEALGADVVYAENLATLAEYRALRQALSPATPMVCAQVDETHSAEELGALGYDCALFGVRALRATVHALKAGRDDVSHMRL